MQEEPRSELRYAIETLSLRHSEHQEIPSGMLGLIQ